MQECGPRFTLKLVSLQHGTFDSKGGEYEWVHKVIYLLTIKVLFQILAALWNIFSCIPNMLTVTLFSIFFSFQPEMDTSRRRFFLWSCLGTLYFGRFSFPFSQNGQVKRCFSCNFVFKLCVLDGLFVGIGLIWRRGFTILKFLVSFKIFLNNFR
jgi:hypothetical protein